MKKAVQVTFDETMLRRLDRDPEVKRHGRSALIRKAVDEYLQRGSREAIRSAYRRGYGEAPATKDEVRPWGHRNGPASETRGGFGAIGSHRLTNGAQRRL